MERYSLRTFNKAALGCWQAVLLGNPGSTFYSGMRKDSGLADMTLSWQQSIVTQERGKLHSHQSQCVHQGLKQRSLPSFPEKKKRKKRVCLPSHSVSYRSLQQSYEKTPSPSLGTVPPQFVGIHYPAPIRNIMSILRMSICHLTECSHLWSPWTFHACREQTKLSISASGGWPLERVLVFVPD